MFINANSSNQQPFSSISKYQKGVYGVLVSREYLPAYKAIEREAEWVNRAEMKANRLQQTSSKHKAPKTQRQPQTGELVTFVCKVHFTCIPFLF
jgi:hypothetical protein